MTIALESGILFATRLPTFSNFLIRLPADKEQVAIVEVLDNITNEIELLRQKRRSVVKQKGNLVDFILRDRVEICSFWEAYSNDIDFVFDCTLFPTMIGLVKEGGAAQL